MGFTSLKVDHARHCRQREFAGLNSPIASAVLTLIRQSLSI